LASFKYQNFLILAKSRISNLNYIYYLLLEYATL
jgi:hypothetical protein